jgi:hypothetical protein
MNGPHEPVYFADRDLGRRFPEALAAAGIRVERHDSHFDVDTPDEAWIREVAARGWVAITRDARIRYSPLALAVLMDSGARLFVLVGRLTTEEAVATFLRFRDRIASHATRDTGPFIAKIRRDGVHVWLKPKRRNRRRR